MNQYTPTPQDLELEQRIKLATDLKEIVTLVRQRSPEYCAMRDAESMARLEAEEKAFFEDFGRFIFDVLVKRKPWVAA